MKISPLAPLSLLISLLFCCVSHAGTTVEKWQPVDLDFKTTITWRFSPTDPFAIAFDAEVTGPDNITFTQPGFYDGMDTWKIRFAPNREGEWTIITRSDVLELDRQQVTVTCVAKRSEHSHGGLRVDPEHPHHFVLEDGTRFFPVGYEANWLFAMDMDATGPSLPKLEPLLDKLSASGFNLININLWAYDTSWRQGKSEAADYGPPLLFPWEGTPEKPDFTKFDLKYWRHFDQVVQAMNKRGQMAYLYFKVYNKFSTWPENHSFEDDLYFRWVIARYAAYPNVIWSLAKEAQYEKSTRYKVDRLKFIRATDGYRRLLTVHDDRLTYDLGYYNDLVDFRSSQEHEDVHATLLKQIASNRWPLFMAESGYEHGPGGLKDRAFGRSNTPGQVMHSIWNNQMTGVYNAYYYTFSAWDIIRHEDNPPGYGYMKNFSDFFGRTKYWLLRSNDSRVSAGRCLEYVGKEYVVYQAEATAFQFEIPELPPSHQAVWYQPLSGASRDAGKMQVGGNHLQPPADWGQVPVVLHVY